MQLRVATLVLVVTWVRIATLLGRHCQQDNTGLYADVLDESLVTVYHTNCTFCLVYYAV